MRHGGVAHRAAVARRVRSEKAAGTTAVATRSSTLTQGHRPGSCDRTRKVILRAFSPEIRRNRPILLERHESHACIARRVIEMITGDRRIPISAGLYRKRDLVELVEAVARNAETGGVFREEERVSYSSGTRKRPLVHDDQRP